MPRPSLVIAARGNRGVVPVTNATEFQAALNNIPLGGNPRLRIMNSFSIATAAAITLPQVPEIVIEAEPGSVLSHGGGTYKLVEGSGNSTRSVYFYDVTFDGGWLTTTSEYPNDNYSAGPYVHDYGRVEFQRCRVQHSRRVGFNALRNDILIFDGCETYAVCRDSFWTNDSLDVTINNCDARHGQDDFGCHTSYNENPGDARKITITGNYVRQAMGFKFLGGGSSVRVSGNVLEVFYPYFCRLGSELAPPDNTGEGRPQQQTNYLIRNNVAKWFVNGDEFGFGSQYAQHVYAVGQTVGCRFENNFLSKMEGDFTMESLFGSSVHCFTKTGFETDRPLTPSGLSTRFHCANASDTAACYVADITVSGSAWSSTSRTDE